MEFKKVKIDNYNMIIQKINREIENKNLKTAIKEVLERYHTFIGFMQEESIEELEKKIQESIKKEDENYIKRYLHSIHFPGQKDYSYQNYFIQETRKS